MLEWMAWTPVTAWFFGSIATLLLAMTVLQVVYPTVARAGWLGITTTRGDRIFISLLAIGWINILWIVFSNTSQWFALGLGLVVAAVISTRG